MAVDIHGRLTISSGDISARSSAGATVINPGTKNYNKLHNKPLTLDNDEAAYIGVEGVEYQLWGQLDHPDFSDAAISGSYNDLRDKPSIEHHVLKGNSTKEQIGVGTLSATEVEKILYLDS